MNRVPLDQVIYTFLDVETTGLSASTGDRICEIALLRCRGGQELDAFQTLVNPGRPISPGAQAVNHITDSMVADAPPFGSIAGRALESMEGAVLVAHNASFDLSFINRQLTLLDMPRLDNPVIDTLALARRHYRFPSNSLGNLRRYMGLPQREEHRAMGDVLTLKDVFMRMVADLEGKGVGTLDGLMEAQRSGNRSYKAPEIILPPEVDEALKKGGRMKIRYVSGSRQDTERVIRPLRVEIRGSAVYLVAYCFLRNGERSFLMDRIVEITPLTDNDA